MEIKISIIGNDGSVEKEYSIQDFRLTMGLCEDILSIMDMNKLARMDQISDEEAQDIFLPMVIGLYSKFRNIMMQIFPDLTEEEYKRADTADVASAVWKIVQYTMAQLFTVAEKN